MPLVVEAERGAPQAGEALYIALAFGVLDVGAVTICGSTFSCSARLVKG
jgi:hypothetical protein